jgi:hypothetical protein
LYEYDDDRSLSAEVSYDEVIAAWHSLPEVHKDTLDCMFDVAHCQTGLWDLAVELSKLKRLSDSRPCSYTVAREVAASKWIFDEGWAASCPTLAATAASTSSATAKLDPASDAAAALWHNVGKRRGGEPSRHC